MTRGQFAYNDIIPLDDHMRIPRGRMTHAEILLHRANIDCDRKLVIETWEREAAWCDKAIRLLANTRLVVKDVMDETGQPIGAKTGSGAITP